MRAFSTSMMAALVVVALFWGNCFSCPQILLALTAHQPIHQCCHHAKPGCQSQDLQHFVKADAGTHVPVMPSMVQVSPLPPAVSLDTLLPAAEEYSPPGLPTLRSILRV